jgi:hypothetical protein
MLSEKINARNSGRLSGGSSQTVSDLLVLKGTPPHQFVLPQRSGFQVLWNVLKLLILTFILYSGALTSLNLESSVFESL